MNVPRNLAGKDFTQNKYAYFDWIRENEPVYKAKMFVMDIVCLSRYQDCADMLRDDRFVRNRSVATGGGGRLPFPVPKTVALLADSMITTDNPEHRRLRLLVNKAFTPRSLKSMESQLELMTHQLLDEAEKNSSAGVIDLMPAYSLPIPVQVISQLMGVSDEDMPEFRKGVRVLTEGMSGFGIHLCLGAWLARLETRVALNTLLARYPDLELAVDASELRLQTVPFWHRYESLPIRLN